MTTTHIYFLLDRSGSMHSIASDVIGGFNGFVAAQRADGDDALMTVVEFDSLDPHEVISAAQPISEVADLTAATYLPRSSTPLYDAMGHTIADATIRAEQRRSAGLDAEEIIFVTFTDGLENHSVEYSRQMIFDLMKRRQDDGWTFAYMGANQDAYAEGGRIGYHPASTQNFSADAAGSAAAFASLSSSVARRRDKIRTGQGYDRTDLFEGDKGAEDDLNRRKR